MQQKFNGSIFCWTKYKVMKKLLIPTNVWSFRINLVYCCLRISSADYLFPCFILFFSGASKAIGLGFSVGMKWASRNTYSFLDDDWPKFGTAYINSYFALLLIYLNAFFRKCSSFVSCRIHLSSVNMVAFPFILVRRDLEITRTWTSKRD